MTTQEVVVSTNTLTNRQYSYPVIMWDKASTHNGTCHEIYYVSDFDQKAKLIAVWDKVAGSVAYTFGAFTKQYIANNDASAVMLMVSQDFTADWKAGYVR